MEPRIADPGKIPLELIEVQVWQLSWRGWHRAIRRCLRAAIKSLNSGALRRAQASPQNSARSI